MNGNNAAKVLIIVGVLMVVFSVSINQANRSGVKKGCSDLLTALIPPQLSPRCIYENDVLVGEVFIPMQGRKLFDLKTGEPLEQ